jgi:hypothetical protein
MDYNLIQTTNYEEHRDRFWDVNPEFKFVEPYASFYTSIKDKKKTSMVMWSVFLLCDIKSPKIRLRKEEREEEIIKHYIKDDTFSFDRYKNLIDEYPRVVLTKIGRELKTWQDKIEERHTFMETLKYSLDTVDVIDKMLKDSKAIWDSFGKVYKEYQEESIDSRARGGREESFTEKLITGNK